ncbi:putative inactive shikimate kinase like 2, chloroplastic [Curcuma longa]|uniref:putative inactive shikimate kinase like 2, chloroplastic n=1 Tax=Curcuma longa TaxID=136217 RepID=UPI003D9DB994
MVLSDSFSPFASLLSRPRKPLHHLLHYYRRHRDLHLLCQRLHRRLRQRLLHQAHSPPQQRPDLPLLLLAQQGNSLLFAPGFTGVVRLAALPDPAYEPVLNRFNAYYSISDEASFTRPFSVEYRWEKKGWGDLLLLAHPLHLRLLSSHDCRVTVLDDFKYNSIDGELVGLILIPIPFYDNSVEVELKLDIGKLDVTKSSDIFVDVDESSLLVRVKASGTLITLMETNCLFERIKPSETIWYIDEDQLVISLKKYDTELKWPDLAESWESLTKGILQLLKGTSIFIVGDSTEINETVADVLATGIGYIPLYTSDLLERYVQQPIQSWVISEGADSVAEAEGAVIESLSRHARSVVATLGGQHGAARRHDKWRHLHAGFTVWLSISEAQDEASAKEETRRHIHDGSLAYSNADVVMKLGGWDSDRARVVAQACLSALKQLTSSDKQLTGKKSLYVRLGCRGDWPNIAPPGWDPSSAVNPNS